MHHQSAQTENSRAEFSQHKSVFFFDHVQYVLVDNIFLRVLACLDQKMSARSEGPTNRMQKILRANFSFYHKGS